MAAAPRGKAEFLMMPGIFCSPPCNRRADCSCYVHVCRSHPHSRDRVDRRTVRGDHRVPVRAHRGAGRWQAAGLAARTPGPEPVAPNRRAFRSLGRRCCRRHPVETGRAGSPHRMPTPRIRDPTRPCPALRLAGPPVFGSRGAIDRGALAAPGRPTWRRSGEYCLGKPIPPPRAKSASPSDAPAGATAPSCNAGRQVEGPAGDSESADAARCPLPAARSPHRIIGERSRFICHQGTLQNFAKKSPPAQTTSHAHFVPVQQRLSKPAGPTGSPAAARTRHSPPPPAPSPPAGSIA